MKPSRFGRRLGAAADRIRGEMFDGPRPGVGGSALLIAFVFGLAWLFSSRVWPGQSWLNGRFLIVAVCFGLWGFADIMPRRWRWAAAALRAAAMLFMLGLMAWISVDFISSS